MLSFYFKKRHIKLQNIQTTLNTYSISFHDPVNDALFEIASIYTCRDVKTQGTTFPDKKLTPNSHSHQIIII